MLLKGFRNCFCVKFLLFFLCLLVLVLVDQLIKFFVVKNSELFDGFVLVPGILKIRYLKNYGAAFGILFNTRYFLIGITVCVLAVFMWFVVCFKLFNSLYYSAAFSAFISGGLGNLIDRIFKGYVVDYCDLIFWPFNNFAVFNLADCLTVFGCSLLFFKVLFFDSDFERLFKEFVSCTL